MEEFFRMNNVPMSDSADPNGREIPNRILPHLTVLPELDSESLDKLLLADVSEIPIQSRHLDGQIIFAFLNVLRKNTEVFIELDISNDMTLKNIKDCNYKLISYLIIIKVIEDSYQDLILIPLKSENSWSLVAIKKNLRIYSLFDPSGKEKFPVHLKRVLDEYPLFYDQEDYTKSVSKWTHGYLF